MGLRVGVDGMSEADQGVWKGLVFGTQKAFSN